MADTGESIRRCEVAMNGRLIFVMLMCAVMELDAEQITMTTWYPAPVGVYQSLVTTGGTPASPVNTILSRDAGSVGIGTSSPGASSKLFVVGDATSGGPLPGSDGNFEYAGSFIGKTQWNGLILGGASATGHGVIAASGQSRGILFDTWNGVWHEAMRIMPSGYVGIGTVNPGGPLDIVQNTDAMVADGAPRITSNYCCTSLRLANQQSGGQTWAITSNGLTSNYGQGNFTISRYNGNGAGSAAMTISPAGAVGINMGWTANPDDGSGQIKFAVWSPEVNGAVLKVANRSANSRVDYSAATSILYVGRDANVGRSINAAGSINANGADYAEWIPWNGSTPDAGAIVKYKGSYLVVSSTHTAAFTGNDRFEAGKAILVAFSGQVPVKVRGKVTEGDYVVPNGDGTGSAVDKDAATLSQYKRAVGTAWESNSFAGMKTILVAIGIK